MDGVNLQETKAVGTKDLLDLGQMLGQGLDLGLDQGLLMMDH